MLTFVRRRVSRQCRRRGESDEAVETARNVLDPNVLTIGFARRFATYKRADLIMADVDRLCGDGERRADRPVQIHLRGKGTPEGRTGQAVDSEDRQLHGMTLGSTIVWSLSKITTSTSAVT